MDKFEAINRLALMAAAIEFLPDGTDIRGCGLNNGGERPYVQIPDEQLERSELSFASKRVTMGSVELRARVGDVDVVAIRLSPLREEGDALAVRP